MTEIKPAAPSETAKALLQIEIVKAFTSNLEMIEALVKAALAKSVNEHGMVSGRSWDNKIPYLDYLVGEVIRNHARQAVQEYAAQNAEAIKAKVKEALASGPLVDAFASALIGSLESGWEVKIEIAPHQEE